MARIRAFVPVILPVALLGAMLLLTPAATAEGEGQAAPPKPPPPMLASDEQAAEALKAFKVHWKAKGLKGDDKVMQRDWALRQIAPIHHPDVVDAIGKATKNQHPDLRMLALIYLADQTLHPHRAGKHVLQAIKTNKKDITLVLTGLQTLGALKYLGARKELTALLKHKYFVVRKQAIVTVGDIGDLRMLSDLLKTMGLKVGKDGGGGDDKESSGGKETTSEGYSWDGAEATVDRGESDNTQENADAKKAAEAQIAKNKAAAQKGAGGGGGGAAAAPTGTSGGGGRGGGGRSTDELIPMVLQALKKLTGEEFRKPSAIREWLKTRKEEVAERNKALDEAEKEQRKAS